MKQNNSNLTSLCPSPFTTSYVDIAKNTLIYSLYLGEVFNNIDTINPHSVEEFSVSLDNLFNKIWEECKNFTGYSDFQFFGYRADSKCKDFSILFETDDFWKSILKQDCILFSFITLRKMIGEQIRLKPYQRVQISNFTTAQYDINNHIHGFDFLTSQCHPEGPFYSIKAINTTSSFEYKKMHHKTPEYEKTPDNKADTILTCTYAPNQKRRIKNTYDKIEQCNLDPNLLLLSPILNPEVPSYDLLSVLEFYDAIVYRTRTSTDSGKINASSLFYAHNAKSKFANRHFDSYSNTLQNILGYMYIDDLDKNIIQNKGNKHHLTLSDKIYLRYQIERVFAPYSINCLYQNIHLTLQKPYSMDSQDFINNLASFLNLPNVFSRQYILQAATDIITKHYEYNFKDSDFFSNRIESGNSIMTLANSKYSYLQGNTKLKTWTTRYTNMIGYFTEILFPVFENYFFCVIWDNFHSIFTHSSDAEIALKMYTFFRDYLNDETTVNNLFDIGKQTKNHSLLKGKQLFEVNSINPDFKLDAKLNSKLYKNCLIALTSCSKETVPTFISPAYLKKINSNTAELIQNFYILESAIPKR